MKKSNLIFTTIIAVIVFVLPAHASATITQTGQVTSSGTSAAPSITHGLTINANDVIVATIHANLNDNTITDNNGSTPFTNTFQENTPATGSTARYAIQIRVAGTSEPASYAWTLASSQAWSITLRVFSGVNTSTPWDVTPSASTRNFSTSDGTTATAPTMTTATNGAMGIAAFFTDSVSVTYSGVTNGYANEAEAGAGESQANYTKIWATTGSTGTTAATLSATNDWTAHQFALKPAVTTNPGVSAKHKFVGGFIRFIGGMFRFK